jgi:hypothetical protein
VDSNFGARREIEISLEEPYRRVRAPRLNKFGLPEKIRYRTADVCAVLGISSDLLRWRFLTGKYSEVRRDARGRLFTLDDLEAILAQTKNLCKQTRGNGGKIKYKGGASAAYSC